MRGAVAVSLVTAAAAASAGKAVNAFCDVMSAIPQNQFTGRKEDMEAVMQKFSGLMAAKLDCSVDPNNKQLGFDLKGVSFAECSAASVKQQQAQVDMIGFATAGSAVCIEKIVDEEANTAAAWMQFDTLVSGHHMRQRVATRLNMVGDKIAGYHMLVDTYQILALQELLVKEKAHEVLPKIALESFTGVEVMPPSLVASSDSARKAVDAFCNVMSAIPKGQFTGRKEDMEAVMEKFSGMMSTKLDCSVNPNNKLLGFDLKGASFAECSAASVKQQSAQTEMIGFSTGGTASCTEKIVDDQENTAAAWMQFDFWVGGHQMRMRSATRFNMDGDKIAGYHSIFDTYQIFALQKLLAREREAKALPNNQTSLAASACYQCYPNACTMSDGTYKGCNNYAPYYSEASGMCSSDCSVVATVASSASAGKAVDAFCDVMSAIPKEQFTGRKKDMEAVMQEFSGLMADKLDCSVDPNNKLLGFDLKGVSFAECSAAQAKQQQAQVDMIGFATAGSAVCIEKIVDEEANTAAAWMQFDSWVGGHHMRSRIATRFNMDGDKIAGYHMIFDTYQIFALQELLARERKEKANLPEFALESPRASSAGRAVDAMCKTFDALGRPQASGGKDLEVTMAKFESLFAEKFDVSEDPNNEMLGFNLKGASFAEFTAAKKKQMQTQGKMLGGMQTKWTMKCFHKIVDADTNNAAVWLHNIQEDSQGNHLFNTRWAIRMNMEGDKIAGIHSVYDTFQLVALSEKMAGAHAVSLSATASSWAGVGAIAFLGAVALVAFAKRNKQKSHMLLADELSA